DGRGSFEAPCRKPRKVGRADRGEARANSASGGGDFFVSGSGNALFKIHQTWRGKHRMRVAVHEPRQNHTALTIQLLQFPLIFLKPGMMQYFTLLAGSDDLSAAAQDCSFFDQADILERCAAPWSAFTAQSRQLADVGQEEIRRLDSSRQDCSRLDE